MSDDPIDVRAVRVPPGSWVRWGYAARENAPSSWWGAIFALVAGTLSLASGYILLDPSIREFAALIAVGIAVVGWRFGKRMGVRSFKAVANEMRDYICPVLVRSVHSDDLMRLASRGAVLLPDERVHARAVKRDGVVFIVASEYDLSAMPYPLPQSPPPGAG